MKMKHARTTKASIKGLQTDDGRTVVTEQGSGGNRSLVQKLSR